ncbi:hypothetical protein, partial [Streptococcus suis]
WRETAYSRCTSHPFSRVVMTINEQEIKKEEKTMGKYQLDDKGKALVARYHEKNSNVKQDKKARVQELLKQAKNKQK